MLARSSKGVNPAALHALEIEFGVNTHQNLVRSAYFQYLGNCLTGQFGLDGRPGPGHDRDHAGAALDARPGRRDDRHRFRASAR